MPKQPKRRYEEDDVFIALEQFSGMNYPSCFKSLLRHAAYDSKSSCLLLDEETLANMEEYITHTGKEVISRLNCCNAEKYQSQDRFRFLPGHRSLILSMPNQIRNMDSVKKKKSKPLREFKKLLTPTELKQLLLIKLNEASEKNGYSVGSYKDTHLKNVQTMITNNELMAKCSVQCFLCQATVTSLYTGWWAVNNVIRHLKSVHYSGERTGLETGSIAQSQNDAESRLAEPVSNRSPVNAEFGMNGIRPSNDIDLNLLADARSGNVTSEELIVEEQYVEVENHLTCSNDIYKRVELENGKFIDFNMEIHRP